jgi:hypothetical protein
VEMMVKATIGVEDGEGVGTFFINQAAGDGKRPDVAWCRKVNDILQGFSLELMWNICSSYEFL